jgi:hypothetical protein
MDLQGPAVSVDGPDEFSRNDDGSVRSGGWQARRKRGGDQSPRTAPLGPN